MPKLTQDNCLKFMPTFMPKTTNVREYGPRTLRFNFNSVTHSVYRTIKINAICNIAT